MKHTIATGVVTIIVFILIAAIFSHSYARKFLESLSVPESVISISKISVTTADGPMPEIALRSFTIKSNIQDLRDFYFTKCHGAKLTHPRKEESQVEPEMLCTGKTRGGIVSVYLYPTCINSLCKVHLEVRVL